MQAMCEDPDTSGPLQAQAQSVLQMLSKGTNSNKDGTNGASALVFVRSADGYMGNFQNEEEEDPKVSITQPNRKARLPSEVTNLIDAHLRVLRLGDNALVLPSVHNSCAGAAGGASELVPALALEAVAGSAATPLHPAEADLSSRTMSARCLIVSYFRMPVDTMHKGV
jgi:hypothetical protein